MVKAEIVKKVAEALSIRDPEALSVVNATLDAVKQTVVRHGRLEIRDFGVFLVKLRKPRVGRNPRDKKEYPIKERRVVTFKMGRELKETGDDETQVEARVSE